MERGLLWLPLLLAFIWLAWSGWNEYHKLEAYKIWAEDFDNAKFDIYAVLGRKEGQIIWGKPTRRGMVELETFSLDEVNQINLLVSDRLVDVNLENLPNKGKPSLEFDFKNQKSILIPFTDILLAAKWCNYLRETKQNMASSN
ncbi:hypothetical protein C7B62_21510 [Pleurocapsa sp. CCALA 161]|uniref:hypothetical protein n=1 Tax=Pleurocapsa sp. CCALA 161 TaxID=2107688 RepID=UPI000D07D7D7|nr:hypothetical protein [Pleurocapsa sp. CCALA 161]PSB06903.1 hypothetical protein C7B62_21510 [Pleurocapsa sp. CCALA 161]